MNKEPFVSILIPVYNVEKWIVESIESLLKQDFENFEIIIVDDCSNDKTFELVTKLSNKDKRIKVLQNDKNRRIVDTLNIGLKYCRGDYILRHDGDDIALPNRIYTQLKRLLNEGLDIVGTQMIPIDTDGNVIGNASKLPLDQKSIVKYARFCSPVTHIWICKREVYDCLKGYRDVPYAEDYDFILRALDYGFKCGNTKEALMMIRHRSGNTSDIASLFQRKGHLYALDLHKERKDKLNDSFNVLKSRKLLKTNILTYKLHQISSFFMRKAYLTKSSLLKIVFVFISCISSYYNAQYIYSRVRVKCLLKK